MPFFIRLGVSGPRGALSPVAMHAPAAQPGHTRPGSGTTSSGDRPGRTMASHVTLYSLFVTHKPDLKWSFEVRGLAI